MWSKVRIPNEEVEVGEGPNLDLIRIHVQDAFDRTNSYLNEDDVVARLLLQCNNGTKIQYAIARAITYGWLPSNKHWRNLC